MLQLFALLAFTKQSFLTFCNLNAILICALVLLTCMGLVYIIISPLALYSITLSAAFNVIYVVYDLQLQMSGQHGYNLQADDYLFAATNIYADIPLLYWKLFRFAVLDHFIRIYKFLIKCCSAEVY